MNLDINQALPARRDEWYDPTRAVKRAWESQIRSNNEGQVDENKRRITSWEEIEKPSAPVAVASADVIPPPGSTDELDSIMREIIDALFDEDQAFKPSDRVLSKSLELVGGVGKRLEDNFPLGIVSRDGKKGIRIEWKSGKGQIRLQVSDQPNIGDYIYVQEGRARGRVEPATEDTLEKGLIWLGQ